MQKLLYFIISLLTLGFPLVGDATESCKGDSAKYHILPDEIGREGERMKTPFELPCDSMVVPSGATTIIHPASMLYFRDTSQAIKKIMVYGTLIAEGTMSEPIFFCGSIKKNSTLGFMPGEAAWQGIEIDQEGKIKFQNVRFSKASSAIISLSPNIAIYNAHFKGTPSIILPDTTIKITLSGAKVDTLEFVGKYLHYKPGKTKPNNPDQHLAETQPSDSSPRSGWSDTITPPGTSTMKMVSYSIGGVGLVTASGIAYFIFKKDTKSRSHVIGETDLEPVLPSAPGFR